MEKDFWTLNGHGTELRFIAECMTGTEPRGVVVAGPAGVGMSGRAREALAAVKRDGCATTTATRRCIPAGVTGSVADLLPGASNGDSADWDDAVRRYSNLVSATVRTFRLQDADARDAVQMTWLRLAENAHRVEWSERLAGWLATTARRECLRILRQAKRTPDPHEKLADTVADPSASPEQRAIEADVARTLWNLVEELPPRQRILLRALFSDHPRPYAEVARTAGIPPGAIGPTRARALQQLRSKLHEHGLGPAASR